MIVILELGLLSSSRGVQFVVKTKNDHALYVGPRSLNTLLQ